ncbi:signal peptidase I [Granulicella arctica]|uniref:Signal peptidase I n=1 Tax=Granulicella arctica TaxID=940613 RepID=A0A7Y9PIE9_9BACT|nr:signal peptidase I [Granulicella arctica]NYF79683.1 signal peptidase I [Granulicella arctica]
MAKTIPTADPKASALPQKEETRLEGLASMVTLLAVWIFVITFSFQNFVIPSASMASTLLVGDHVLVDRASLAPSSSLAPFIPYRELQHDEPVVFFRPAPNAKDDHDILVKRVIGLPGDRIHLRHGIVYRNGVALHEPYAAMPTDANYNPYNDDFPAIAPEDGNNVLATWSVELPTHIQGQDLVVPTGYYFVMGDNRPISYDSRYWGLVPRANLIGRPLFVYWSFKTPDDDTDKTSASERTASTFHTMLHFFDETRWSRTLHRIE